MTKGSTPPKPVQASKINLIKSSPRPVNGSPTPARVNVSKSINDGEIDKARKFSASFMDKRPDDSFGGEDKKIL